MWWSGNRDFSCRTGIGNTKIERLIECRHMFLHIIQTRYRIHSNRRSFPNRHPPPPIIKVLANRNKWNWWFLYKKYMDKWWTGLVFAIILFSDGDIEVRFWAYHYVPSSSLAQTQCITIRMNTVSFCTIKGIRVSQSLLCSNTVYNLSNVITLYEKFDPLHQYSKFHCKSGTIVFSRSGAIARAKFHLATMVFARVELFVYVYHWAALYCEQGRAASW